MKNQISETPTDETSVSSDDEKLVEECSRDYARICDELAKVIIGQNDVIEQVLIAMISRGHALLEGAPGLAKTLLVSSLAESLHLTFKRIQFTPDMMPSDITGADVIQENTETGAREYRFLPGPLFANLILADEVNRTPPKTQAAMLEAMQERHVSAGGTAHKLDEPFFVLATQNPLEQEGTYPLPEAQLDRFLLFIKVDYPTAAEEWEIARRVTSGSADKIEPVISAEKIIAYQDLVLRVPISDQVLGYAWALVRATRPGTLEALDFVDRWVQWGAGPRGVLALITAAKTRAILNGRFHATVQDIQAIARASLRHRIAGNFAAQAAGIGSERLLDLLLEAIPVDRVYARPPGNGDGL